MAFYRWTDLPAGMGALAGHTWAHRVDTILAAAETVRPRVAA